MIRRNDFILIGAVILISLATLIFINVTKADGSRVVVTVHGREYASFRLDEDTTFTVKSKHGVYNTFQIKNRYVRMLGASCPDKLCIKQKPIHYNHETIVCLPNQVILEVTGSEEDNIDMIAN